MWAVLSQHMRIGFAQDCGHLLEFLTCDCVRWFSKLPLARVLWANVAQEPRTNEAARIFERRPVKQEVWRRCKQLALRQISIQEGVDVIPGWYFGSDKLLDERANITRLGTLLRHYGGLKALASGKRVHDLLSRHGFDRNTFLGNCLVEMYGNCRSADDARAAFEKMLEPNLYSCNIMIHVYTKSGRMDDARDVFERIPNPDLYSWTILVNAYGQNGSLDDARSVFDRMPERNVVSWTAMIAAFVQNGHAKEALSLFWQMQLEGIKPNKMTFTCALDACANLAALEEGQKIHAAIDARECELDIALGTSLINMYGKCGNLLDARRLFTKMPRHNVVSWTAMIAALSQNEHSKEALDLLCQMQLEGIKPDKITFLCALNACTSLANLRKGQEFHAAIVHLGYEQHVRVGNALINMYGRCGKPDGSKMVFDRMSCRDVISWTAMVVVFAQNCYGKWTLDLFHKMQLEGIKPDKIALICALDACSSLAALENGKEVHAAIFKIGIKQDVVVGNSLLNMYGKCGSLHDASSVFGKSLVRDVVTWNTMIAAFAQNGEDKEVLDLFCQMQLEGINPDKITFIGILAAFSYTGWIDDGRNCFVSMIRDHSILHTEDHYVCMIDLLGRAGLLDEAEYLIRNVSSKKVVLAWLSLLGACRIHGDVERGVYAANQCFELDSENATPYVLLSNIFSSRSLAA